MITLQTAKQADQTAPAASPTPTYYIEHPEIRAATWAGLTDSKDGNTLFRALARLVYGDPSKWEAVRKEVMHFALYIRSNKSHPLHATFMLHEEAFRQIWRKELFAVLDCPDVVSANEHVCWVMSHALKIQMRIFNDITPGGELRDLQLASGPSDTPKSVALLCKPSEGIIVTQYSSLMPDESGKELVEYLQSSKKLMESQSHLPASQQKFAGLPFKQMSFAWQGSGRATKMTSFNEFRPESKLEDLTPGAPRDRMDTFVALVNKPEHMKPALELFFGALERAPNQKRSVKVSPDCNPGRLLPHCAVDCEFVKTPRDLVRGKSRSELNLLVAEGKVEELCSVITLAVGKHCSLVINPLHMLETANEKTVSALEQFFQNIILNADIMKLWWNLQRDIPVLDNTISYMYQSIARPRFWHAPNWREHLEARWVSPTFKFNNSSLNGTRPASMDFPRIEAECDIHIKGKDSLGISCPCSTGNIDIAALFSHLCRLHGFWISRRTWDDHRDHYNYCDLINHMLGQDRIHPLLYYMKDQAGRHPTGKDSFYQGLGKPGMEFNDNEMGYVIMDVISQNCIFEQFFVRDDTHAMAEKLLRYTSRSDYPSADIKMNATTRQRPSPLGHAGSVPLFDDYPKRFVQEAHWKQYSQVAATDNYGDRIPRKMHTSVTATSNLAPWQHDERVKVNRGLNAKASKSRIIAPKSTYPLLSYEDRVDARGQKNSLLDLTMDPSASAFWVPSTCAIVFADKCPNPIVRAGTTHTEALIAFLKSPKCKNAAPPPGFGAPPGHPEGLDRSLKIVPGAGLEHARNIYDAFQGPKKSSIHLGRISPLLRAAPTVFDEEPDYNVLVDNLLKSYDSWGGDRWQQARQAREYLIDQIEKEVKQNEIEGLPSVVDCTDYFDPEGREYRRRIEAAPEWNRPHVDFPILNADGSWKSVATEMLKVLDAIAPPEKADEQWEEARRKRWGRGWR